MQSVQDLKRLVAYAAIEYVEPGEIIGVGSGTTTEVFVQALCERGPTIAGAVASSERTAALLRGCGIRVLDLNDVCVVRLYVDGADEIEGELRLIKGGGGALAREKILATASELFVCIADESKMVDHLGRLPVPVEVLPFAREFASRQLHALGGDPTLREGVVTDNGNQILDVSGLDLSAPTLLERDIDGIPGVVANGIFAHRHADIALLGTQRGLVKVKTEKLDGAGRVER